MKVLKNTHYFVPSELVTPELEEAFSFERVKKHSGQSESIPLLVKHNEKFYKLPRNITFPNAWRGVEIEDCTAIQSVTRSLKSSLKGRDYQEEVVEKVLKSFERGRDAVVKMPCGAGKTITSILLMLALQQRTAVILPTEQLLLQWEEVLNEILGITCGTYYGKRKKNLDSDVVLILVQSVKSFPEKQANRFGFLVGDEVHQLGAEEWGKAVEKFPARYRLGLSATPERADNGHFLVFAHFGSIVAEIPPKYLEHRGYILKPRVVVHRYPQKMARKKWGGKYDFVKTCTLMAEDENRNKMLLAIIEKNSELKRDTLTVTNRLKHFEWFEDKVEGLGQIKSKKDFKTELSKQHIMGIFNLVKQGLDKPSLQSILLAVPVSDEGMTEQLRGRLSRLYPDKDPWIHDIVDSDISLIDLTNRERRKLYSLDPVERSFLKRLTLYKRMGMDVYLLEGVKEFKLNY